MKILTLNTWQERGPWRERWEITLEGLDKIQPDIIAFQELFNPSWSEEVQRRTGFKTLLFPQEYCGLVLYTRHSVISWGVVTLSQSPLEEYLRYALWAELRVGGKKLFVFNTHLSWKLEDQDTRRRQTEEVLQLVKEKSQNEESVLMGDLNAPPDSPEISWFIKEGKFRDLFEEKHPHETVFSWDNQNPYVANAAHKLPDRRIDYILTRGSAVLLKDLVSCDLIFTKPDAKGIWASDHFGVLAEIK